jgi:hypothetical protein
MPSRRRRPGDYPSPPRAFSLRVAAAVLTASAVLVSSASAGSVFSVAVMSQPTDTTVSTTATFSFDKVRGGATSCSLDSAPAQGCSSPVSYSGLAAGPHTFTVNSAKGDDTVSATSTWTILTTPTVAMTAKPADGTSTEASFSFTLTDGATATCSLDSSAFTACTSPRSYSGLGLGGHVFTVRASGPSGSANASASWSILAAKAPTTTTSSTTTTTATTTATTTTTPTQITPSSTTVAAPQPPTTYSIPSGAVQVSTSSQLIAALQGSGQDIVLADGTYDSASPFNDANGNRLYAEHLGGATLTAGLIVGGNWGSGGGLVRGVNFDVSSSAKVLGGAIVHVWGAGGVNSQVLDCYFRGNWTIPAGIKAYQPTGFAARRLEFYNFTDFGLLVTDNVTVAYGSQTPHVDAISDIYVNGVSRPTPGSSNGTAEQGLLIGNPVNNSVQRIKIRNVAWDGIETANNSWDTTFSDLDLDMSNSYYGVGVYLEHYSYHDVFRNFVIRGAKLGINMEWNDPFWSSRAAAHYTTIANGTIDAAGSTLGGNQAGVYLQPGTESTTVQDVIFKNQNWAGIGADNTTGTNAFSGNDYSALKATALPFRTTPLNG